MTSSRQNSDRVVFTAALLTGLIGLGLYLALFLTVLQYGQLNLSGQLVERIALLLTAATLLLSLYLALTAHSRTPITPALSGAGWFMVVAGVLLACLALGGSTALANAPGVQAFSSVAGALFLIMAGAGLLQAERNVRERHSAH